MNKTDVVVGQTLLVELDGECVVGELTHVCSGRTFIRLSNVRDVSKNMLAYGSQAYYNSEIRNIQILNDTTGSTEPSYAKTISDGTAKAVTTPAIHSKQLTIDCLNETLACIQKYVFINQTDSKYHEVIKFLKKQRELGISMERIEQGRHTKSPSLLSIATRGCIFIFDIKWIRITQDIGDLLGSDRYRRVIHNGRFIRDVLQHLYGVAMGKCFDTMIAHIAICKTGKNGEDFSVGISIKSCVEKYLKLPENFFDADVDFDERPLNDTSKREAAKKVAFLLPLQDHFTHEIMLQPFYDSCKLYADSLAQNSDFIDSLAVMRDERNEAVQQVKPFSLAINIDSLKDES